MKKTMTIVFVLLLMTAIGLSCNFKIEAESQTVNSGDEFYLRITVVQDHGAKCVLPSNDEYQFDAQNFELLGWTGWEEVANYTLQSWIKVKALDEGSGWVKIWKNCRKEGYDEQVMNFVIR